MKLVIILLIILLITVALTILSLFILIILFYTRVPFVRTPLKIINQILKNAKISPNQTIYDLGCGDARFLIEVEKHTGAKTVGFELSPWAYFLAKLNIWFNNSQTKIFYKNFYKENLAPADVIFCFLLDSVMEKVGKQLEQQLKPGATVISFAFHIPQWKPSEIIEPFPEKKKSSKIYIYQR